MTDINLEPRPSLQSGTGETPAPADDGEVIELIELLFFAYRDFVSDPDEILTDFGFGRAHHRVIHFVGRNPGIRVADLLDILKITKQSLARVLRQLVEQGFIVQHEGRSDRRQRLLYLTDAGSQLAARLMHPQIARVRAALEAAGPQAAENYRQVLTNLIDEPARSGVAALITKDGENG